MGDLDSDGFFFIYGLFISFISTIVLGLFLYFNGISYLFPFTISGAGVFLFVILIKKDLIKKAI